VLCSKQKDSKTTPASAIQKKVHSMENCCKEFDSWNFITRGIRIPGVTFTTTYNNKLKALGDYRIDGFLQQINSLNLQIADLNSKIYAAVQINPDAMLIKSIPGVGDYSSLVIASEIGGISRFNDSHKLCAYAGVVPSVRNSADIIHHGNITKRGSMTLRWVLTVCVCSYNTCQEQ